MGLPLPGVNVMVKGTTTGVITNDQGMFSIDVEEPEEKTLVFSFIGFETQEVKIGNQTSFNITMMDDFIGLDEVVAVGYGIVQRRDLTGAVGSIDSKEIAKVTTSNAIQAIQAKIPGVDMQQSSGEAGSGVSINLRGNRSLSASNSPLIIVDGIEYGSTIDINPSDIESIDVLKDASSTAIYGSRGANGVIIITTKRGKAGKTVVNFNSYLSSNRPTHIPQVMYGKKEVQRLIDKANYQADAGSGDWGSSKLSVAEVLTESGYDFTEMDVYNNNSYTDWLDIILQNGLTQNYEVSVAGGEGNTNFMLSAGAMFEEGLMKNDKLDRYNVKSNIDHKINDYVKVGTSLLYTYRDHDSRQSSVFGQALKMSTIAHAYDKEGEIIETPNPRYAAHVNPLMDEKKGAFQRNNESSRFFGNGYLEIEPIEGLTFKTVFALDRSNRRIGLYQDYKSVARYQSPGTTGISLERQDNTKYVWENVLNYTTDFDKSDHDLILLLGHSMQQTVYEQAITHGDAGKEHYYQSGFYDLTKIGSPTSTSAYTKSALLSYFGRANYQYLGKYLLTVSMRADGTSTTAKGNEWGYFPSVSGAWRLSDEGFMDNTYHWLSNLKLRAAWGITGNSAIAPYQTLGVLSSQQLFYHVDGKDIAANIPSNFGNPNLKWETTSSTNIGLDFGLLNNRISGVLDFFMSDTYDLLYYKSAPASSVYPSIIDNIGETKARGVELLLTTAVLRDRDYSWNIDWSFSSFKDEVVAIADGLERNIIGRTAHIVGEPVNVFYDYETTGIWDVGEFDIYIADWEAKNPGETHQYSAGYGTPGTIKINDVDGDGKLDDDDKVIYNRSPKFILGMNNTIAYKNWTLSALLYARMGGYMQYDMNSQLNFESANWGDLDYWTLGNKDAKFPSPGSPSTTFGTYGTSLLYEKADYIKLKDITLSYNLPTNFVGRIGLGSVRVYGSLKNYFTYSSVKNYDSERGGSINFPLAKQMVFGLNVQF